jgi:hypothetical protein
MWCATALRQAATLKGRLRRLRTYKLELAQHKPLSTPQPAPVTSSSPRAYRVHAAAPGHAIRFASSPRSAQTRSARRWARAPKAAIGPSRSRRRRAASRPSTRYSRLGVDAHTRKPDGRSALWLTASRGSTRGRCARPGGETEPAHWKKNVCREFGGVDASETLK